MKLIQKTQQRITKKQKEFPKKPQNRERQMLTDYQIKENIQKIKLHLYKRNQRTRGLEKKMMNQKKKKKNKSNKTSDISIQKRKRRTREQEMKEREKRRKKIEGKNK